MLLKMIFRKKRPVILRLAAILVSALLMMSRVGASSVGNKEEVGKTLFLDYELVGEGDIVKINLKKSGDWEICGLLLTLVYDGEAFDFSQCDIGEGLDLNLAWQDSPIGVTLLLDGTQNSSSLDLVSLFFQRKEGASGFFFFTVLQGVKGYVWAENGELLPLDIEVAEAKCEVRVIDEKKTEFFFDNCELFLKESTGGTGEFVISAQARGFDGVALGFKLFIVNVLNKTTQAYTISSLVFIEKGTELFFFEKELPLSPEGRFCLVVTPISYTARGYELGEKIVFYIRDGEIYK